MSALITGNRPARVDYSSRNEGSGTRTKKGPSRSDTADTAIESVSSREFSADDAARIAMAEYLFAEDKLLAAYRLLQEIQETSVLRSKHRKICEVAEECEAAISDVIAKNPDDSGWTKQGESHSRHDTLIYYKVGRESRLTCFVETPIEASLLVPLLSVLNESDLYQFGLRLGKHPSWVFERPES